jgi:hypothetical protein
MQNRQVSELLSPNVLRAYSLLLRAAAERLGIAESRYLADAASRHAVSDVFAILWLSLELGSAHRHQRARARAVADGGFRAWSQLSSLTETLNAKAAHQLSVLCGVRGFEVRPDRWLVIERRAGLSTEHALAAALLAESKWLGEALALWLCQTATLVRVVESCAILMERAFAGSELLASRTPLRLAAITASERNALVSLWQATQNPVSVSHVVAVGRAQPNRAPDDASITIQAARLYSQAVVHETTTLLTVARDNEGELDDEGRITSSGERFIVAPRPTQDRHDTARPRLRSPYDTTQLDSAAQGHVSRSAAARRTAWEPEPTARQQGERAAVALALDATSGNVEHEAPKLARPASPTRRRARARRAAVEPVPFGVAIESRAPFERLSEQKLQLMAARRRRARSRSLVRWVAIAAAGGLFWLPAPTGFSVRPNPPPRAASAARDRSSPSANALESGGDGYANAVHWPPLIVRPEADPAAPELAEDNGNTPFTLTSAPAARHNVGDLDTAVDERGDVAARPIVIVRTRPPGAEVTRGRQRLGTTPLALPVAGSASQAKVMLKLRLPGYVERSFTLSRVTASDIRFDLQPVSRASRVPR